MSITLNIETEDETDLDYDIPSDLSHFILTYGGFGENSFFSQIQTLLTVDLSLFQHQFYDEEYDRLDMQVEMGEITEDERDEQYDLFEENSWIEINTLKKSLELVLYKAGQSPEYYKKLKTKESEKSDLYQGQWNYFESGRFEKQIKELIDALTYARKEGETKVRFVTY